MTWTTWAQIASLLVIGSVLASGTITAAIKEWTKARNGDRQ